MTSFLPPTVGEGGLGPVFGYLTMQVGVSVVKVDGVYTEMRVPWLGDLTDGVEGVDYFLGGHVYTVTGDVADALEADGFL